MGLGLGRVAVDASRKLYEGLRRIKKDLEAVGGEVEVGDRLRRAEEAVFASSNHFLRYSALVTGHNADWDFYA